MVTEKKCSGCGVVKALAEFELLPRVVLRRDTHCIACREKNPHRAPTRPSRPKPKDRLRTTKHIDPTKPAILPEPILEPARITVVDPELLADVRTADDVRRVLAVAG